MIDQLDTPFAINQQRKTMRVINPTEVPTRDLHQFLIGSVGPRPIAFASTINEDGSPNLAPYSFFNAFSSNPPILVFSSNRRVSDNTTKDTLHNIRQNGEVVINVVNYSIVRQMAVTSVEFDSSVSEFDKSGLTPIASDLIKPYRVKESPVQMECRVKEIVTLGEDGGAGHLIICDVLRMHIEEEIIDDNGRINPHKIDLVGRMGRSYYTRASGNAIFTLYQPVQKLTVGFDNLPANVRRSKILTGNDLGRLAGLENLPSAQEIKELKRDPEVMNFMREYQNSQDFLHRLHLWAGLELENDNTWFAAKLLMLSES